MQTRDQADRENIEKLIAITEETNVAEWAKQRIREAARLMSYYRCAMMEIETKFNVLNEEFSIRFERNPINSIRTRLKSFSSIREKLERRGLPVSIDSIYENLYDVAGVRVICSFPDDVYKLAEALLKQDDITLIEQKDYIKNPKPSGYRSLHLIVSVPIFLEREKQYMKVEIQLRTIAMDVWASLEHQLHYKKETPFTSEMERELRLCATLSAELDDRMDALRCRVFDGGEASECKDE